MTMSATFHEVAFRGIVRLYPESFRLEFGEEMTAVFCERIERRDNLQQALSLWIIELLSLPSSLMNAYAAEGAREVRHGDRPPTMLQAVLGMLFIAASIFGASWSTTHNIANVGMFNEISLVVLVAGLGVAGSLFGIAHVSRSHARRWHFGALASAMLFAALLSSFWIDRGLQRLSARGTATYMRLPGVTAEFLHASDDAAGEAFAAKRRASNTPRFRVETTATGDHHYVRVVRAGRVDWLYGVIALMIVAASAHVTSRRIKLALET
jgi:hypothetical protein